MKETAPIMYLWIVVVVSVILAPLLSTATTLHLQPCDCSKQFMLPWDHSSTVVRAFPDNNTFEDGCNVTFCAQDKAANILFEFGGYGAMNYIYSDDATILFYLNNGTNGGTLVKNFTSANSDKMLDTEKEKWSTSSFSLIIYGGNRSTLHPFAFDFTVRSTVGPISGYPFSIAFGVIALCLGGLSLLTLLGVCCYCCCCTDYQEMKNERRGRIINQLRKEGYSVTRSYGAVGDTTPILGNEESPDIFSYPPPTQQVSRLPPPAGSRSNHDPPPPYHSVSSLRQAPSIDRIQTQHSSLETTEGGLPTTSTHQSQSTRMVPEAILVEISTGQEDLMQFEASNRVAAPPAVDLLTNDVQVEAQPAFGAVY